MDADQFIVEVTTTLYLGFVAALLSRDNEFWTTPSWAIPVLLLWLTTAVLVWLFVRWQFALWSQRARFSNAAQTLMARWLTTTHDAGLDVTGVRVAVILVCGLGVSGHWRCCSGLGWPGPRRSPWARRSTLQR